MPPSCKEMRVYYIYVGEEVTESNLLCRLFWLKIEKLELNPRILWKSKMSRIDSLIPVNMVFLEFRKPFNIHHNHTILPHGGTTTKKQSPRRSRSHLLFLLWD